MVSLYAAVCESGTLLLPSVSCLHTTVVFRSKPNCRFRTRVLFIYFQRENRTLITQKMKASALASGLGEERGSAKNWRHSSRRNVKGAITGQRVA